MVKLTNRVLRIMAVFFAGLLTVGLTHAQGQKSTAGSSSVQGADAKTVDRCNSAAGGVQAASSPAVDARTEKQKALAQQAEKLFDMATELKVQVDKTNKNILSMKVVEKAEEIESLAKGMKTEARRSLAN